MNTVDIVKILKDEQKVFDIDAQIQQAWDDANNWRDQYMTIPIEVYKKQYMSKSWHRWHERFMSNPYSDSTRTSHVYVYPNGKKRLCNQKENWHRNNIYKWTNMKIDMMKTAGFSDDDYPDEYEVKIVVTKK